MGTDPFRLPTPFDDEIGTDPIRQPFGAPATDPFRQRFDLAKWGPTHSAALRPGEMGTDPIRQPFGDPATDPFWRFDLAKWGPTCRKKWGPTPFGSPLRPDPFCVARFVQTNCAVLKGSAFRRLAAQVEWGRTPFGLVYRGMQRRLPTPAMLATSPRIRSIESVARRLLLLPVDARRSRPRRRADALASERIRSPTTEQPWLNRIKKSSRHGPR